jgi:hypothetical protein
VPEDVGVVVHVYDGGTGYEVELVSFDAQRRAPPPSPPRTERGRQTPRTSRAPYPYDSSYAPRIDMCRAYYELVGLGAEFVDRFVR